MIERDENAELLREETQRREIEAQILEDLTALPPTKYSIPNIQAMDRRIGALEKTIKGLNGFIRFLSKLNPMEYLRWMAEAFSSYVASSKVTETSDMDSETLTALPAPIQVENNAVRPGKAKVNKKRKRYVIF